MEVSYDAKIAAPFGVLGIRIEGNCLTGIDFLPGDASLLEPESMLGREVRDQLQAYLSDPGFRFEIPTRLVGTPFQMKVWQKIANIPSGKTLRYGDISKSISSSPRAVGQACGSNPIPLVIPCHRVVSAKGMGGFMHKGEGLPLSIKRWLIEHESD